MFLIAGTISFFSVSVVMVCVFVSLCSAMCTVPVGMGMVCSVFARAYWKRGVPFTVFDE